MTQFVFSDHCPGKMSLSIRLTFDEVPIETKEFIELEQSFQWSEEGSYKFFKALGSEHIQKGFRMKYLTSVKKVLTLQQL